MPGAIRIAAALGGVPQTLIQRRDETRYLAAGYAQFVARAPQRRGVIGGCDRGAC